MKRSQSKLVPARAPVSRGWIRAAASAPAPAAAASAAARAATRAVTLVLVLAVLCGAPQAEADTLAVTALDGQTGEPLEGVFVLVGSRSGDPFAGNYGFTGPDGTILFDDPALAGPQTVTAAADGYGHTTLYQAATGEVSLPLFPPTIDPTMGGTITHVEGDISGISTTSNDGYLDAALVLPAVSPSEFILGDRVTFSFGTEMVNFPMIGDVELPENSYLPSQIEYYIFTFSKSPWRLDVAGERPTTFSSVSGRISIDDLIAGADLDDFEIRELGVERDVMVSGPMNVSIQSDLTLSNTITAEFVGVPAGSDVLAASGGLLDAGGEERIVGYGVREGTIAGGTTYTLAGLNPSGDMSDALSVVVGAYADSSASMSFASGIMERDGFTLPHTEVLDSWFLVPDLVQDGRVLQWSDPSQPGLNPPPTWTRSVLGLRPIDPENTSVPVTAAWRVYAPAGPGMLELPTLPPVAPGPLGGLPDPDATPDADQLYWELSAADAAESPQAVVGAFLTGATHWSMRWIPMALPVAEAPQPAPPLAATYTLHAHPVPSRGPVTLSWHRGDPAVPAGPSGTGWLEILDVDGRLLLRRAIDLAAGSYRWDGGGHGRPVGAGFYWARVRDVRGTLAARGWLYVR